MNANKRYLSFVLIVAMLGGAALACNRSLPGESGGFWSISNQSRPQAAAATADGASAPAGDDPLAWLPQRTPGGPQLTPTPDAPHTLPALRTEAEQYTVQPGDSLGMIAARYSVNVGLIVEANDITDPNLLSVGQSLVIPVATPQAAGPGFKILPDSELVNGPFAALFDVQAFVEQSPGYLASYKEEVDEQSLSGAQIVAQIGRDYSVSPRLLLAVLQHQSGWLSERIPKKSSLDYPLGLPDPKRKGLYRQLAWAANNLNRGYYLWRSESIATWTLADSSIISINPTINAGTAAVQQMFALLYDQATWEEQVSPQGFYATYTSLFGFPFDYAIEPLLPYDLFQPTMQLPFEEGATWYFTSGPHGGWGDGAAWAAIDFAPPGGALGCVENDNWVTAVADGRILRAENGAVIQDLDGDGLEQTGWVVLYMHVEGRERVQPGAVLKAGDRIGHPSCEGGISSGTHLHLARKYNGEWIPAGYAIPFVLSGWIASGTPREYDGYLTHGSDQIEAYAGIDNNGISR